MKYVRLYFSSFALAVIGLILYGITLVLFCTMLGSLMDTFVQAPPIISYTTLAVFISLHLLLSFSVIFKLQETALIHKILNAALIVFIYVSVVSMYVYGLM